MVLLCMLVIPTLQGGEPARALSPDSLMVFRFLKTDTELPKAGSYFNVLQVQNNDNKPLNGRIEFWGPDTWSFIGQTMDTLSLQPGESRLIPLRISVPQTTQGGISYVIGAELSGQDVFNYTNSYVSLKRISRWDMQLNTSQVYLTDFRPDGDFYIKLNNTGNADELIKISFDLGGLLEFNQTMESDSFLYVEVPANQDTSLQLSVRRKTDLSYAKEQSMIHNWRERSMTIKASTLESEHSGSIRVTPLESSKINQMPFLNTPLNVELTMYNLLSQQRKRMSARVFGKVLFPDDQQLSYALGYYNIYFDQNLPQDKGFFQNLRYMIRYNDPRSEVWIGDRISTGMLHTLTGMGFRAYHTLNNAHRVDVNVIHNPFVGNIGGFAGYTAMINNLKLNTGVTLETTTNQRSGAYTMHLGGSYIFAAKHSIELQTATSVSNYGGDIYQQNDTTLVGFAYQLKYKFRGPRLQINAENFNTLYTYMRSSGQNRIYLTGSYEFTNKLLLKGRYYRTRYSSTQYPYNFLYPANTNANENARFLLSYNAGNITYQGGPHYYSTSRTQYFSTGDYTSQFMHYKPGIMGSVTFRLGHLRSISPNASLNYLHYRYTRDYEDETSPDFTRSWVYTLGINYYDQAFKLNATYSSGESTDIYRSAVINNEALINQSIQIRPYYERYFLKEKIRVSAFLNYSYYMPSQRENLLLNITGNVVIANSWNLFGSFNTYQISRKDLEVGRMTNRYVNMMAGIRKAFEIQQPRLAYHDLSIIGFNDLDGDGIRDENEKPISNVLINISRDPKKNETIKSGFAEITLITDPNGRIYYEKIPAGIYNLTIIPLTNLEDLYLLHGQHQSITIGEDMTYYLPLVESYKIRGRIIIDRDPNSSAGMISPEGIRITASSETGESYSTLSDNFGAYTLDLPRANVYEIKIFNVFGEDFRLERDSYKVQFLENRTISLDFRFTEKRRTIKFNQGEEYFQFNLDNENRP